MTAPREVGAPSGAAAPPSPARSATERAARTDAHTRVPFAPKFGAWWAAATYAIAALALGYPAFGGAFLVSPHSDQYIAGFAFREFAAESLRSTGSFPLWNPYMFGGMPYVAAMHGDIFYPTFLLRLVMPTDTAMTWGFIIHTFLAGLFTFAFVRACGFGFFGALIGGLAYMLSGNVAGLVSPGHDGKLFISALLPLALLCVLRGFRDGRHVAWGALALVVGLAVLTPHPQLLQYLLLVVGAFALFLAFSGWGHEGDVPLQRGIAVRRLGLALMSVVMGGLIGAIQFLPVREYVDWSPRAGGKGWDHAVSYSMPTEELLNFYLPQFTGMLEQYWGRNVIHLHSEYIGASVLALAALAFGVGRPHRKYVWFWLGALVVATLWALGGQTPFYRLVYAIVPGTKFFRAPSTMLFVVSFCIALLAAVGVDRALSARVSARYLIGWIVGAAALALLATSGILTGLAQSVALPGRESVVDANGAALVAGAWRSFLAVALLCAALFALVRGLVAPRLAGWLLVGVVGLDLWSILRLYWRFSAPAAQVYASDPVIDYLRRLPQPGRVVPIALAELDGTTRDPYFGGGDGRASGFMVHGIRTLFGYHGNELGRYDVFTGWGTAWPPQQLGNPNFWRLANLRYLYTNVAQAPIEGMRLVAGPARNAAGSTTYLFEFPGDNPIAWVTPLAVKAPDDNVLATVLDPRFDVRRVALFDTASAVAAQPVPEQLPEPLNLTSRVTRYEPGRIELELSGPAPRNAALVVSENYYPGWRATVDGRPVATGRVDYVLLGIALPEGARRVALAFESAPYETGKTITLVAIAVAIVAAAVGWGVDRRRVRA